MLEILGREYVIDHCISRLSLDSEEKFLKVYITDALKLISENTACLNKNGRVMTKRFVDFMNETKSKKKKKEDKESAEEIISKIKTKLGKLGAKEG